MKSILKNSITWLIIIDFISVCYYLYGFNNTYVERPILATEIQGNISPIFFWNILEILLIHILWISIISICNFVRKKRSSNIIIKTIETKIYWLFINIIIICYGLYLSNGNTSLFASVYPPDGLLCRSIIYITPNIILHLYAFPILLYVACWIIINILIVNLLRRYK